MGGAIIRLRHMRSFLYRSLYFVIALALVWIWWAYGLETISFDLLSLFMVTTAVFGCLTWMFLWLAFARHGYFQPKPKYKPRTLKVKRYRIRERQYKITPRF